MKVLRYERFLTPGSTPIRVSARSNGERFGQEDIISLWLIFVASKVEKWNVTVRQRLIIALAAMSTGLSASDLDITHDDTGRPKLNGIGELPDISIAHREGYLTVAVGRWVDIDIEILRGSARQPDFTHFAIACGDSLQQGGNIPKDELEQMRLWILKEACLKSKGRGIAGSFRLSRAVGKCWCEGTLRTVSFQPLPCVILALAVS